MAEEPTADRLSEARLILAAAVAAAGKMDSSVAWRGRVNVLIPEVGAMFGARSNQMRRALAMVDAVVFTAVYFGNELEESSTRLVVKLEHPRDKDHPDGIQRLRTERTDTPPGKLIHERLAQVAPGSTLLCWKAFEEIRSGENAGRQAAVLMHFEVLPDRKTSSPPQSPSGGEAGEPRSPSSAPRPPGSSPPAGPGGISRPEMDAFNEATKDWDNKTKVALVRDLAAAKLWPPTPENRDAVLTFTAEWSF